MSQQVLARKFRPQSFADVVGQTHVVSALTNALTQQRLHHAYLFTGTRGVGKTTLARILAKAMSCETGITPTPCETCIHCTQISSGSAIDIFEIDAASHTKVDETKEIISRAMYPPSHGRFRIFIIDEVHMLSKHSFNALLKTLEEPPSYVKFILATTNPEKLPDTILSRCLHFHLAALAPDVISQHLARVLDTENISYEKAALSVIAENAKGSMRDALSITEPVIAFSTGTITEAIASSVLGLTSQDALSDLLLAIIAQDATETLQQVRRIAEQATDISAVIDQMLLVLHRMTVAQLVPSEIGHLPNKLQNALTKISPTQVQLYYQIALKGAQDLAYCPSATQCFEMICLRQVAFHLSDTPRTIPFPVDQRSVAAQTPAPAPVTNNVVQPAVTPKAPTTKSLSPERITVDSWAQDIEQIPVTGMTMALLKNTAFCQYAEQTLSLELSKNQAALFNDNHKKRIEAALSSVCNISIKIDMQIIDFAENTPIKQAEKAKQNKKQAAEAAMLADNNVQTIMKTFDAKLHDVTPAEATE